MGRAADIGFGNILLCSAEEELYREFNSQIMKLVRSLPRSMQTNAMLFTMEYTGISMGQPLDFFRRYYAPAWSVLHCIGESPMAVLTFSGDARERGVCAHAMAMFLHSLDDHLHDGQIPSSHLMLLIRSQAWFCMRQALADFARTVPDGPVLAEGLLDTYYTGITAGEDPLSLDEYCERFRQQMATWLIVPVLTALGVSRNGELASGVRAAYESFGIAWRLLDDLQDLGKDMLSDERSAVYVALPAEDRTHWNAVKSSAGKDRKRLIRLIANGIRDAAIIENIRLRIGIELDNAAGIAEKFEMHRLASEYRDLAAPIHR